MVKTEAPLHCVPDRPLPQPELERANACLAADNVELRRRVAGLQQDARDIRRAPNDKQ